MYHSIFIDFMQYEIRRNAETGRSIYRNRRQIEEIDQIDHPSMWKFIEIISGSLYDVCGVTGHVGILNPRYFREFDRNNKNK